MSSSNSVPVFSACKVRSCKRYNQPMTPSQLQLHLNEHAEEFDWRTPDLQCNEQSCPFYGHGKFEDVYLWNDHACQYHPDQRPHLSYESRIEPSQSLSCQDQDCPQRNQLFKTKEALQNHNKDYHNPTHRCEMVICPNFEKPFPNVKEYMNHLLTHYCRAEGCPYFEKTFITGDEYDRHVWALPEIHHRQIALWKEYYPERFSENRAESRQAASFNGQQSVKSETRSSSLSFPSMSSTSTSPSPEIDSFQAMSDQQSSNQQSSKRGQSRKSSAQSKSVSQERSVKRAKK